MNKKKLILKLNQIGAIKFGQFKLKSGMISPIYIDLRILISYSKVLKQVAAAYLTLLTKMHFDRIAAIPYAAIPIATAISLMDKKPFIYTRKEVKKYGTKKQIEGEYRRGEKVVLIDDLITTGLSKIEAIRPLKKEGLIVKDIVVLIDREQGGGKELHQRGYRLHSVLTMSEILNVLLHEGKITPENFDEVKALLKKKY